MTIEEEVGALKEHARNTTDSIGLLRASIEKMDGRMWSMMKAVVGFLAAIFLSLIGHILVSYYLETHK